MQILGISAYYHDSAACLIKDGKIVAAAQEERFTRKKHDSDFPINAIRCCLDQGNTRIDAVDKVVFYEKPFLKFERLLKTYLAFAPKGLLSFFHAIPIWIRQKLFMKSEIADTFTREFAGLPGEILFNRHHRSHAAAAFFPSPFKSAAVLCLDGVGEWATTSAWQGTDNQLKQLWEIRFPHSLGLLYSAFTYYTGFKVNSGEYKLMGLAPYGEPEFTQTILDNLIDLKPDGTFRLNMKYFNYCTGLTMTGHHFDRLFGAPPTPQGQTPTRKEMNLARSIQEVTEEVITRLAKTLKNETGESNLCLAGGVALNCVANGKLVKSNLFEDIWIQPAAGDAGGALGAALDTWFAHQKNSRKIEPEKDMMQGCYLGCNFTNDQIEKFLNDNKIPYEKNEDNILFARIAKDLQEEKVIGWFNGRMEFGPRALGARSIIGDARSKKMQSVMNLKIKFRESFRPFAPSVLYENLTDYFELSKPSPYMLLTAQIRKDRLIKPEEPQKKLSGLDLLNISRSDIPAVTHVDNSARIQTVHHETNPRYHAMIKAFKKATNCPVIVNTSFNVRGEPIVCTPKDAYKCFIRTNMDRLVLQNFYLLKENQPKEAMTKFGSETFSPD
jgi:carbamoyltransferase